MTAHGGEASVMNRLLHSCGVEGQEKDVLFTEKYFTSTHFHNVLYRRA